MATDAHLATRELEILNEVARIATLDLELRPMMQRITDALAERFDWEFVALAMLDPDREHFHCEAVTSRIATEIRPGYRRAVGTGIVGRVFLTQAPVVIDEAANEPTYIATADGIRSEICVPVKHGEELVAVLNLESTAPAAFAQQVDLLVTVANQIAGAIASARLIEQLRDHARLMQLMSEVSRAALDATTLEESLDRIVQFIHEKFEVDVVSFLTYDPATETFLQRALVGAAVPRGDQRHVSTGVVGRCIRERRAQYVRDVSADPDYAAVREGVQSELAIPIVFRDDVLGVLNLESERVNGFDETDVTIFEAVANQIAGAIRLTTLTEMLEEKRAALEEANRHLGSAIETLHRLSTTDAVTGLANRRRFDETLDQEWRRAMRNDEPIALLMIDIDSFKAYNDRYGHPAGDAALAQVAASLQRSFCRAGDLIARYGGEEFAALLPATTISQGCDLAEQARRQIAELSLPHDQSAHQVVTVSIGVASLVPQRGERPARIVDAADAALYEAKRNGRNRVSSVV